MYAGNPIHLGRFEVQGQPFEKKLEDWIPTIRYFRESPIVIRGAMNPWQQERDRQLATIEDQAWKEIQRLQGVWEEQKKHMAWLVNQYNMAVKAIEDRMRKLGKKSPFQQMGTYGGILIMTPFSLAGWIMEAIALVDTLTDVITGKTRKLRRDIQHWINTLQSINTRILALQAQMDQTSDAVRNQLSVSESVKSTQAEIARSDSRQAEQAYQQKLTSDMNQANIQRKLVAQAQTVKRRVSDVL